MSRIRVNFSKNENLRYTGTLDLQKIWERTLRRADLPIQYSKGFHPQPKIQIACPLPLGMTSDAEIVDFWLENDMPLSNLTELLNQYRHPGIDIAHVLQVPENSPSLQNLVTSTIYQIKLPGFTDHDQIETKINTLIETESVPMERRGKKYDLRPLIESIRLTPATEGAIEISLQLSARPGATGRPEEVLKAMDIPVEPATFKRISIVFS